MSCSNFDWKGYLLGEIPEGERRQARDHAASCAACAAELERLRLTHAAMLTLGDEEMPRRIAFVSDKVFEPGRWRRFWSSGPRLGFASAAMLSAAILAHALIGQPAAAPPPPDAARLEAQIEELRAVAETFEVLMKKANVERAAYRRGTL
jgi:anti-sigma factor RsiW